MFYYTTMKISSLISIFLSAIHLIVVYSNLDQGSSIAAIGNTATAILLGFSGYFLLAMAGTLSVFSYKKHESSALKIATAALLLSAIAIIIVWVKY